MSMREIKLELVRHGPPHNQLLSPLTPYLALCENHPPVTVHVPFEHNQFLYRLKDLYYKSDATAREFQLVDMGRAMGALLGQIPGLIAELNKGRIHQTGEGGAEPVHLRLILSSSELAVLPFELAFSAEGMPGTGLPLLLQSEVPICLTREVRRSRSEAYLGIQQRAVAILFAWACPDGFPDVPCEAHLLALRQAVDPWVAPAPEPGRVQPAAPPPNPITVLPRASLKDIEDACARTAFTHVHILAHGHQRQTGFDFEYGLALHASEGHAGEADVVLGDRLASALSATGDAKPASTRPDVVTIASCYGGAPGSLAGAGSSVAHALHVEGVPLVLATQFPLSFAASVRMVESVYHTVLWGEDPRPSIAALRRRLHAELPENHDWAGVSAYLALDPEFDAMLLYAKLAPIWMGMELMHSKNAGDASSSATAATMDALIDRAQQLSDVHFRRSNLGMSLRDRAIYEQQAFVLSNGLGRFIEVRAQNEFASNKATDPAGCSTALLGRIEVIRGWYWAALSWERVDAAPTIRYLWLDGLWRLARHAPATGGIDDVDERSPPALWAAAHVASLYAHKHRPDLRINALQDLTLLYLIRPTLPDNLQGDHADLAVRHASDCVAELGTSHPFTLGLARDLERYLTWYQFLSVGQADKLSEPTGRVLQVLRSG